MHYKFFRFDKEKSVEVFNDGGWHFNNILEPEEISKKLKTFAHTEYSSDHFTSVEKIRKKIEKKVDLFDRGEKYQIEKLNDTFPEYLIENKNLFKKFIV